MSEPTILIIDDEPANVFLLESVIKRLSRYETHGTTDPRQALALVQELRPDLILLDLTMPHVDGFAIMESLRATRPPGTYLPVLVLTADITPHTRRRALASGANDFLTKPFEHEEVMLRCKNLLETRALHLALQSQNTVLEDTVRQRTRDLETTLEELRTAQKQQVQQERLRALGEMSGGIAHDLNNHLTVLVGYTELLLLNDAQMLSNRPMARHYLGTVRAAANDSAAVVTRLREFGRRREDTDVFLPLNLPRLVQEAATFTQPKWRAQARATGRTVNVRLELGPLPDVAGNAEELREVVANLIFNAVDAMPQGGDITLRTRRAGDGAVAFEVADTGIGMTEEVQRRCVEPFFTTKNEPGAGMGLAVAYGIVKRHEGNLDILTQPGYGTTVSVRLPVAKTTAGQTQPASGAKPDRPLRVLLVEDDLRVREVVSEYLRRDQHEVSTAESGGEALEKFAAGQFDLVVTDLALKEMNGEQLATAIKQRAADCPVILLTGFADTLHDRGDQPSDFDAILRKPLLPGDLWRAMAQVMAKSGAGNVERAEPEAPSQTDAPAFAANGHP